MRDFCVKSYRESFDRIGWLWAEDRANHELEQIYQEALPLVSSLVYIAILLTKEELI